jgi:Fe-S-cluster-containing dehydrogenase component/CRP-like cAMP-binding protein
MSFGGSELQRPKRWDKPFSDTMTDEDIARLMSVPPFSEIDESQFRASTSLTDILKNDTRLVPCEPGDIVIRKGDWGSSAFFILSGRMRVEIEPPETSMPASVLGRREIKRKNVFEALAQLWKNHRSPEFRSVARAEAGGTGVASRGAGDRTRVYLEDVGTVLDQYRTATIDSGQFFGEIAALGRTPRVATVFSEGEGELLEIRWQGLRDIMRRDVALRMYIEQMFRERALSSFLRTSSMFSHLSDDQMDELCAAAEFETFGQYDSAQTNRTDDIQSEPIVAQEGHYPNGVILIRSGVARLSQKFHNGHKTVGYLTPGQTFGYEEIAEGGKPLRLSLRAIGYLAVVIVPAPVVETLVVQGRKSSSKPLLLDDGRPMQSADAETAGLQVDNDLLEFVVEGRFIQGTASMVIDLDRCTRCDDCVRACATAHDNNPRFIRHGPIHENYMVANACMHCEDPVCMIECPTGAIHRNQLQGNVIINDQTCIGCSRCANNCPYDSIRMVEIRDGQGNLQIDSRNQPIVQATKCDLCVDQIGGPACQRACPHDALQRIDLRSLVSLREMVNR